MDRINAKTANIVTRAVPSRPLVKTSSSLFSGDPIQIFGLPPIPRWVGVAVVAATTALGAAGCYYYFYSRRQKSSKKAGSSSSDTSKVPDLKEQGNEFFKKQEFGKALDCYSKAIQSGDKTPEQLSILYQNRAAVWEKLGDKVQVINECTCALKYQPNYVKALMRRAKAYKDTGFLEEALEDVTKACILDKFQHGSTVQLVDEVVKDLGVQEAKKIYKVRHPSEPSHHFVITFLRSFHEDPVSKIWNDTKSDRGQMDHVATNGDSSGTESGYLQAIDQLKKNKFNGIIQLCTEEIGHPDSPVILDAYLLRGTFKYLFGYKSQEVLEDFKTILESSKSSDKLKTSAWIKTALNLFNSSWDGQEEWKEAFEKAAKLSPNNVDVYFHWGQLHLLKGEFTEAQNKINKAVECNQQFPLPEAMRAFLSYRIALMNENSMEMGEAFVEFDNLKKKWPKCPEVYAFFGQILMELQRFDEALEAFDHVLKIDPLNSNTIAHKVLCKAQKSAGIGADFPSLLKEAREGLKIDAKNAFLWETIATLQVQLHDRKGAAEAMEKAIESARAFPEVVMLSALKIGSEMQFKVKDSLGE